MADFAQRFLKYHTNDQCRQKIFEVVPTIPNYKCINSTAKTAACAPHPVDPAAGETACPEGQKQVDASVTRTADFGEASEARKSGFSASEPMPLKEYFEAMVQWIRKNHRWTTMPKFSSLQDAPRRAKRRKYI